MHSVIIQLFKNDLKVPFLVLMHCIIVPHTINLFHAIIIIFMMCTSNSLLYPTTREHPIYIHHIQ